MHMGHDRCPSGDVYGHSAAIGAGSVDARSVNGGTAATYAWRGKFDGSVGSIEPECVSSSTKSSNIKTANAMRRHCHHVRVFIHRSIDSLLPDGIRTR
jgi:hypothetical protein